MVVGMLWYDNDPHTALTMKVNRAVDYYRQKYFCVPDTCLVHSCMISKNPGLMEGGEGKIIVRPNRSVLPGHLWIGIEDKN